MQSIQGFVEGGLPEPKPIGIDFHCGSLRKHLCFTVNPQGVTILLSAHKNKDLPILVGSGVMGMLDLLLDVMSILVGSIAIGLMVDDTVQFNYNFRGYQHINRMSG